MTKARGEPEKRPRGGQPRAGEIAKRMLRVRMTDEEWTELEQLADKAGVSMSEYVRRKVFGRR